MKYLSRYTFHTAICKFFLKYFASSEYFTNFAYWYA